jgi:hypothetical protein
MKVIAKALDDDISSNADDASQLVETPAWAALLVLQSSLDRLVSRAGNHRRTTAKRACHQTVPPPRGPMGPVMAGELLVDMTALANRLETSDAGWFGADEPWCALLILDGAAERAATAARRWSRPTPSPAPPGRRPEVATV